MLLFRTLGEVIDRIFQALLSEIQRFDDFGVEETEELHRLFTGLQQEVGKEFPPQDGASNYVPVWNKFQKSAAFFDMSMVGIVEMWEKADLQEFTAEEIRRWINALFSDSAFRQKNLRKVVDLK